ncbi:hypothetical protein DL769_005459 [Monosporascus sp. CRB-8-3]|nr:hypothetical protein DL769_005459 [Monosporascus sp. CRB-8-3]
MTKKNLPPVNYRFLSTSFPRSNPLLIFLSPKNDHVVFAPLPTGSGSSGHHILPAIIGSALTPAGLSWFEWTAHRHPYPHVFFLFFGVTVISTTSSLSYPQTPPIITILLSISPRGHSLRLTFLQVRNRWQSRTGFWVPKVRYYVETLTGRLEEDEEALLSYQQPFPVNILSPISTSIFRFPITIISSVLLPVGLFWFTWTAHLSIDRDLFPLVGIALSALEVSLLSPALCSTIEVSTSVPTGRAPGRALLRVPHSGGLLSSPCAPVPARRIRPATQADGEFMAEILRYSETKIEIPHAARPKIAAAGGTSVPVSVYRRISDVKVKKDEDGDEKKQVAVKKKKPPSGKDEASSGGTVESHVFPDSTIWISAIHRTLRS